MNNLSYSTFIPTSTFTVYGIKPCPIHGQNNTITSNDGNKTQRCAICNWTFQNVQNVQNVQTIQGLNLKCANNKYK